LYNFPYVTYPPSWLYPIAPADNLGYVGISCPGHEVKATLSSHFNG
jgi:hypothetical protein